MTREPLPKKPRWTADQRRARTNRTGVECRAAYAGHPEYRLFDATTAGTAPSFRAEPTTGDGVEVTGTPIVYSPSMAKIQDQYGSFIEQIAPGALTDLLANGADVRFLIDHDSSRLLARTLSGTMQLTDSPTGLQMSARLDVRDSDAMNTVVRISRGDLREMSCAFVVAEDTWSPDFSRRTISRFQDLQDVSVVTFPAYSATTVELGAKKKKPDDDLYGDGTVGGSGQYGLQDGTGSRSARALKLDLELLAMGHRKPLKRRVPKWDPRVGVR
jgi:uncharacterized protein